MPSVIADLTEIHEVQRLTLLVPRELRAHVAILRSPAVMPILMTTRKVSRQQFSIQIDFVQWFEISPNQRDLLFWHEVARIQSRSIPRFAWEMPVISLGLLLSLTEVLSQNVILLAIALAITGLAVNQYYQRNRGERHLKELAVADCTAVKLAMQAGYSFYGACNSLYDGLQLLQKQTSQKSLGNKYQVRLQALEILAASKGKEA